jgi:dolichol-phosphate mannosyltransferase
MTNINSYSVILPTLNESGHIKELIYDIAKNFNGTDIRYEILIVDDNSKDGTCEIIKKIKNKNLILIQRINKKPSLVGSLNDGIKKAKYKNIIWMDADYSHPPKYIKKFLYLKKKLNSDTLIFSRFLKASIRHYSTIRYKFFLIEYFSVILNFLSQKILFKDITDYTSGFICINKKHLPKNLNGFYGDYFINLVVYLKIKKNHIREIPFVEQKRKTGFSKTHKNKFKFILFCFFYLITLFKCYIKIQCNKCIK